MRRHYRIKHLGQSASPTNPQIQCEYPGCGRKIKGKVNLPRHYQTTHLSLRLWNPSAGPSRVKCAELECDKTFVNKYTMAKHYQNVHGVKSLHFCDHCDWKTPDRNTWLFDLLKAHDQRQLLVAPLRPGMDVSELEIFLSNRDKQLQGDALLVTNMTLRSIDSKQFG